MKQNRFITYGYTIRDGHTVIQREEAEVIRRIYEVYVKGASLKEIADELTREQIPYTEKTTTWDKARISRILENARYLGTGEYDPIIDEKLYEEAVAVKAARNRNQLVTDTEAIRHIRDRVRCEKCGAPMVRKLNSNRKIKESWVCSNDECGSRVRVSDTDLLVRINLLINRIITNNALIMPTRKTRTVDSLEVASLQREIDMELMRDNPSETLILARISDIAATLYDEANSSAMIAAQVMRKRIMLMRPQETFNQKYFAELIEAVMLGENRKISIRTKTGTMINEGDTEDGNHKDP